MITSGEIARICGVSRGTVDRVLHHRSGVNKKTREAVLRVMQSHGYRPNYLASSLSRRRTNTIGILIFDLDNRFFAQCVSAAEKRLRELGYFAYLVLTHKNCTYETDCILRLQERRVDGIIIFPIGGQDTQHALENLPAVTIGNRLGELPHIGINEYAAGALAATHILAHGYRNAVYIAPALAQIGNNIWAQQQRMLGFSSVMDICILTENDFEKQIPLYASKEKTAFFCSSDIYALRVLQCFEQLGIMPGRDAGLMGFDHIDTLDYVKPRIDTVSFPMAKTGLLAAEAIIAMVEQKAFEPCALMAHVVPGQTLGDVPIG